MDVTCGAIWPGYVHTAGPSGCNKRNRLVFLVAPFGLGVAGMTRMGDKKNNLNFVFLITPIGPGVFVIIRMGGKKSNLICQFINKLVFHVTPFGLGFFVMIRMGDKRSSLVYQVMCHK